MVLVPVLTGVGGAETKDDAQRSLTKREGSSAVTPDADSLIKQVKALRESLALAGAEADMFRAAWQQLKERDAALGVDALTGDEKRLQEKLVQAVRDAYAADRDRNQAVDWLEKVLAAAQALVATAGKVDPVKRADYEAAVRGAGDYLAKRRVAEVAPGSGLSDGQVVAVKPELGLAIINLGQMQGAKAGMPFQVIQNDRVVGRVKVFRTREGLSAVVVEGMEKGRELHAGDRVRVAAEK